MFDSLDERMKHDDAEEVTQTQRALKWVAVLVLSVAVFGGLWLATRMME